MRLASYNVENLFLRARALNQETWKEGKPILEAVKALNTVLAKAHYGAKEKREILALLRTLKLDKADDGEFAVLRQNRGKLLKRPRQGRPQVVAAGRDAWIGWVELKREEVNETATRMTARVVVDLDADVLGSSSRTSSASRTLRRATSGG